MGVTTPSDADRKAAEEFLDLYIHDKVAFEHDTLAAAFARRAAEARKQHRDLVFHILSVIREQVGDDRQRGFIDWIVSRLESEGA